MTRQAIIKALIHNIPFVAYSLPGSGDITFMADCPGLPTIDDTRFSIVPWLTTWSSRITISNRLDAQALLNFTPETPVAHGGREPWATSTTRECHAKACRDIIEHHKSQRGGKTVLSRTIAGSLPSNDREENLASLVDVAFEFFDTFPGTFRAIYFTPATGAWLVATPELLLDITPDGHGSTMALAGTLPADGTPWDTKNAYEHELVNRFILDTLSNAGAGDVTSVPRELLYGDIRHLCHDITFTLPLDSVASLLDTLSPTPALAGYPRQEALGLIGRLEWHERRCYGGYLALEDGMGLHAWVNLRCLNFDAKSFCVYVGGGITADSVVEDEWLETTRKAAVLSRLTKTL